MYSDYRMESTQLCKSLSLKKQRTMNESIRYSWSLPKEYFIVVCFLGLIKKGLANINHLIKQREDKANEDQEILRKLYLNSLNFFDYIVPMKNKLSGLKNIKEVLTNLKKQAVQFFKQVKQNSEDNKIFDDKKSITFSQIGINQFQPGKKNEDRKLNKDQCLKVFEKYGNCQYPISKEEKWKKQNQIIQAPIEEVIKAPIDCIKIPIPIENLNKNERKTYKTTKTSESSCEKIKTNRLFIISVKKLNKKIKEQCSVFQNLNNSLASLCEAPGSEASSKGLLEIFEVFSKCLIKTKNQGEVLSFLMSQNKNYQQRIQYFINQLTGLMKIICILCFDLCQWNKHVSTRIKETIQRNMIYFKIQKDTTNSTDKQVSYFVKCLSVGQEVIKIAILMPRLGYIKSKQCKKPNIIAKMSQFRYLSSCLNSQVNIFKQKKLKRNKDINSFESKWQKIYDNKFGRLKTTRA